MTGNTLKKIRRHMDWSERELAELLGCNVADVRAMEGAPARRLPDSIAEDGFLKSVINRHGIPVETE